MLIESSHLIGRLPSEICVLSETIQSDPAYNRSMESVLDEVTESKGHDLFSRFKEKKPRTTSLSGLVLGLGNRLLSKGGVASESGDNHVTTVKRKTSMKRHSSADDLICSESTKRR